MMKNKSIQKNITSYCLLGMILLSGTCLAQDTSSDKNSGTAIFSPLNRLLAAKPPMGWNSWDCFGTSVTEAEVKSNATYMAKNLKKFGWQYIIIDLDWYGPNLSASDTSKDYYKNPFPHQLTDSFGRVVPAANKFPSCANGNFKPMGDWLHQHGLKFGLHVMRGIPWQAIEKNTPVEGTNYHARDIVKSESGCNWYDGMRGIDFTRPGAQEYYNSLYKLFADWGVDFVKADDMSFPYYAADIEAVRKAIDLSGSDMVLSLSPGSTSFLARAHVQQYANMFRISEDFWDAWPQLKNQFVLCERWSLYQQQNHWADLDMLPLGKISIRAEEGKARQTNFTKNEQLTMMTLWAIFRSPLMFGGNLPDNDDWTNSLLTNEEVLAVNQEGKNVKVVRNKNLLSQEQQTKNVQTPVWYAESADGKYKYVALFNLTDAVQKISLSFSDIDLEGNFMVRDLWERKDIGLAEINFSQDIQPHAAGLYRINIIK
jgi:alpha-galactosidase